MGDNTALLDRRAQLWRMVAQLNLDETEAIMSFVAKLLEGKDKHGALDLATDARDWDEEIRQEMVDAAFYAVFKSIQRARRRAKAGPVVAGLRELREAEQIVAGQEGEDAP